MLNFTCKLYQIHKIDNRVYLNNTKITAFHNYFTVLNKSIWHASCSICYLSVTLEDLLKEVQLKFVYNSVQKCTYMNMIQLNRQNEYVQCMNGLFFQKIISSITFRFKFPLILLNKTLDCFDRNCMSNSIIDLFFQCNARFSCIR